jgi:hypothetical protein
MKAPGSQPLIPQQEEQITELKWVGDGDMKKYIANTYPSIIDVLRTAGIERV